MYLLFYLVGLYPAFVNTRDLRSVEVCDINHRDTSCPAGYCCARDEFILEDVLCKPIGRLDSACSTVPSENQCPCMKGLYCRPDLKSENFISIYGHCHNRTIDNAPTTTQSNENITHNFPPQINLESSSITVPITTPVGKTVLSLNVTDNDNETDAGGKHNCKILNFDHFIIEKMTLHRFDVKVGLSLLGFVPQILEIHINCEDDGDPPTNNVAVFRVYFVYKTTTHIPANLVSLSSKASHIPLPTTRTSEFVTLTNGTIVPDKGLFTRDLIGTTPPV